jgi:hypothetical protein
MAKQKVQLFNTELHCPEALPIYKRIKDAAAATGLIRIFSQSSTCIFICKSAEAIGTDFACTNLRVFLVTGCTKLNGTCSMTSNVPPHPVKKLKTI